MSKFVDIANLKPVPKPRQTRSDKWKQRPCVMAYRTFADELRLQRSFIAAEVTSQFEKYHGKLSPSDAKGLGNLYGDLQVRGVIRKNGEYKPRKNGNLAAAYELVR
jgi:hypothetical protein